MKATYNAITSFNYYTIEITGVDVNINTNVALLPKVLFTSREGIPSDKTSTIREGFVLWQKDSIVVGQHCFEIENLQNYARDCTSENTSAREKPNLIYI